jgi:M6 family metalloprotease-like protein
MRKHARFVRLCWGLIALFIMAGGGITLQAAPYNGDVLTATQPDGSTINVKVFGDEFYIRAESMDGYTLVKDPQTGWICYARLNADGSEFISTGVAYRGVSVRQQAQSPTGSPGAKAALPQTKALKLNRASVLNKVDEAKKILGRDKDPAPSSPSPSMAPGSSAHFASGQYASPHSNPISGPVKGLTLLIEFPDERGSISRSSIDDFCNQRGYTGYNNFGSVRDYFAATSNNLLDYTNYVTEYYCAQHPQSYYTDPSQMVGNRASELVVEGLNWLEAGGFDFSTLSNNNGVIYSINAFYAGQRDNVWAEGLWPHCGSVDFSADGMRTRYYQISDIGSELSLGTFCHENGHMLLDYPDLYDYGYESCGPGNFCLMAYGGNDKDPTLINPYFRWISGWETMVDIQGSAAGTEYTHTENSFTTFRYANPDLPTEYFLLEGKRKLGAGGLIAHQDSGLLIWHIDEYGDNDCEQMTPAQHYMVSVEQADGYYFLENPSVGPIWDNSDLFRQGYRDQFHDATIPNAHWWSGRPSGLNISQIGPAGSQIRFVIDQAYSEVLRK